MQYKPELDEDFLWYFKNFMSRFGKYILIALITVFATFFIKDYLEDKRLEENLLAAQGYEEFLSAPNAENLAKLEKLNNPFYVNTAKLMLAGEEKDYAKKIMAYQAILQNSQDVRLKAMTLYYLAYAEIANKNPSNAISLLENKNYTSLTIDSGFNSILHELLGDAYLIMENPEKAKEAYIKAYELAKNKKNKFVDVNKSLVNKLQAFSINN